MQRLAAAVHGHAARLVRGIAAAGCFDAVTELAAELPLLVLADLLGVPRADRSLLLRWSNHLVGFDDPDYGGGSVDQYRDAFAEAFAYAQALAASRRRHPPTTWSVPWSTARPGGRPLSRTEFCQLWLLLVIAGNETTRHLDLRGRCSR